MIKELQKTLIREDIQMATKHMKRCSMSLVITEMQTKTIITYHFTATRKSKIKITDNTSIGQNVDILFKIIKGETGTEGENVYRKTSNSQQNIFQWLVNI